MKIFHKFYIRRLYRAHKIEDIIEVLDPWADEVLYKGSPFLWQVASYILRTGGNLTTSRFLQRIVADEIMRLNELEDLKAATLLAIVESFHCYDPSKGNVDLPNWLSWRVPYELSKLVTWKVIHPVGPFEEAFFPAGIEDFEITFEIEKQIGILAKDLKLDRHNKYYYLRKVRSENETYC